MDALLDAGWPVCATAPGAVDEPAGLERAAVAWCAAKVPGTAAGALRAAGAWSLDGAPRRFDAEDWWWRTRFDAGPAVPGEILTLCLDGLATAADVWLDGAPLLSSTSMFVGHRHELGAGAHELVIRCRALDGLLAARRPRPRWRAPMIEHQQLRWWRTTLLGRTPSWSPPAAAVGPWRPVRVERQRAIAVDHVRLAARLDGDAGVVEVSARLRALSATLGGAELVVTRDGQTWRAPLAPATPADGDAGADRVTGRLVIPAATRWWPHTHGEPARYHVGLAVVAGATTVDVDLGAVGFRDVAVDRGDDGDGFAIRINGTRVFCRGACWTPLDPVTLGADAAALRTALVQVRDAGMNMLRVGGTMVYEDDAFYDLADELGLLIWQDFMFANMDYPGDDAGFAALVADEADQVLARLQARPSLAVLCGNSEGEQQAAMWGAARELWQPALFHEALRGRAAAWCPEVPYWPSSAHGGAFPHQADVGTASYYGVGAYQRPLDDARRADVKFASECLAFANVPSPRALARMPGGAAARVHHPGWKARTPRDLGAGWDFDDVRDHYVARLFGVDPAALRYADHDRYLALGRVATGEVMAQTFGEWRRRRSRCGGGLIWFLRDLWPGAGWGVIDADGGAKAAYHYLRRALAPLAVHVSDEGGNGLTLHVVNDGPAPVTGELDLALFRGGDTPVGHGRRAVTVAAHDAIAVPAAALLDGFVDLSWAYRFGPPACDVVVATLVAAGAPADAAAAPGAALARAFHFPAGLPATRDRDLGVTAEARPLDGGDLELVVRSRRLAHAVAIDLDGFVADDDHFCVAPGAAHAVRLRRTAAAAATPRGSVQPLNAETSSKIVVTA
ncbi:MAG: glycoside hydrolase family 2 protein [Kofleriaceae bacterium]|nr:glycoside hydrolase family 2 protein [Kofleriaceae bacterium]